MRNVRYEGEAVEFGKSGHIRPQGQGTITYLDGHEWAGCRYEGEFLGNGNGHPHGQGKWYRDCEGEWKLEYEGESQQGKYHGQGTVTYLDDEWAGHRYEGEFIEDYPHGQGKWYRYYEDEDEGEWKIEYAGEFQQGEYHGEGTLYNPDGTIQRQGRWATGEPEDSTPSSAGDDSSESGS